MRMNGRCFQSERKWDEDEGEMFPGRTQVGSGWIKDMFPCRQDGIGKRMKGRGSRRLLLYVQQFRLATHIVNYIFLFYLSFYNLIYST